MHRIVQRQSLRILLAGACLLFVERESRGADWRQFRGEDGRGTSSETGLPVKWSAEENIAWKTPLPGFGASSPITVGNRIFLTCYSGYGLGKQEPGEKRNLRMHVLCLDRPGGAIKWDKSIPARQPPRIDNATDYVGFTAKHGYASSTPASDGNTIYAFFGDTGVVAYDLNGQQLWTASVGTKTHGFGTGASVILSGNLLIVNASIESESVIALDKATGKEVWRAGEIRDAWNTPVLVDAGGEKKELVVITKEKLLAFEPRTGQPLWNCVGSTPPRYICPSATTHNGIVYAIHGYFGPTVAVRSGGRGDVTGSHQLWSTRKGSNVSSPVYHEGHLYWVNDQGMAFCVNATTGKLVYQERFNPPAGDVYASPIVADGKLYYVSRKNGTFVLAAQPRFEVLSHNQITTDESIFNASPAVSGKGILLRSDRFLYYMAER
jgi:outer membrane protein assembly factor BamB